MQRSALWMTPIALGAWISGCSSREADIGVRRSVLRAFESCGELETYLEDSAIDQIGRSYYGWGWGVPGRGIEGDFSGSEGEAEGELPPTAGPTAGDGGNLTGTNNQEAGVDEADFVKSDSRFIYVLHGNNLVILNAFPAAGAGIVSETPLEGWPGQMFISGDLALVLGDAPVEGGGPTEPWNKSWTPRVRATVLDLGADRVAPTVVRQSDIDGFVVGARMVGRSARVVTAHYTPIEVDWNVMPDQPAPQPPDCGWGGGVGEPTEPGRAEGWAPEDCEAEWEQYYRDAAAYQEAYIAAVREHNVDAIRALTLDDLVPQVDTNVGGDTTSGSVSECTSFYRTEVDSGYGLVSVNTFDLDHPTDELDATTIVGDYGLLYASEDQLYVAMAEYPEWSGGEAPEAGTALQITAVHQFDIGSDPRSAAYIASGEVPGRLNNSFSMDEHDGYLRIATTIDRATADWSMDRDNSFTVLAPHDGLLEVVGQIDGIARDEQIYAARLFDQRGYLVTFRTVDPLFALDLSDPTAPTITGELEIPGFSQYMHPLGDGHLLTIGTAADDEGFITGLQLSIFDVSDPTDPRRTFNEPLGAGYSEAQSDHKAFTFKTTSEAGDEGILGIPVSNWETGNGAELLVFDVTAASGFVGLGSVNHSDLFTDPEDAYCYLRDVRRSVMSDDHVYSISYAGFKVNPLDDLTQTTASAAFEQTDLCGYVEGGGGVDVGAP